MTLIQSNYEGYAVFRNDNGFLEAYPSSVLKAGGVPDKNHPDRITSHKKTLDDFKPFIIEYKRFIQINNDTYHKA